MAELVTANASWRRRDESVRARLALAIIAIGAACGTTTSGADDMGTGAAPLEGLRLFAPAAAGSSESSTRRPATAPARGSDSVERNAGARPSGATGRWPMSGHARVSGVNGEQRIVDGVAQKRVR